MPNCCPPPPTTWITILQALLTPAIGIAAAIVAFLVMRIQQRQHRLALFDRRMKVFDYTMELISTIVTKTQVEIDELMKFIRETRDHKLLFGPEVEKYIDDLYKQGAELNNINFVANNPTPHNPQQVDHDRRTEILHWFVQQQRLAMSVFQKYMGFREP